MTTAFVSDAPAVPHKDIALWRIYLLRAGYLMVAIGMGVIVIPAFLHHGPWTLTHGVMNAMLLALVLLCVLGLRYPLKMLPLLVWEMIWKASWLALIAYPAWHSGTMDADVQANLWNIGAGAVFLFIVPWDYVWRDYVAAKGDRLR
jgi:hypothetical protein